MTTAPCASRSHHRHQRIRNNQLHFAEHGFAKLCAVTIQEPFVGLRQVPRHEPTGNRVVSHLREMRNCPGCRSFEYNSRQPAQ